MKHFRFLLVAVIAFGLLLAPGCATIQAATSPITNFFCHPTTSQVQAANIGKAVAQAILVAAGTYIGGPVIAAISTQAIPIFDKVIAGYCVLQADWDQAAAALAAANTQTKAVALSKGAPGKFKAATGPTDIDNDIAVIQAVQW